MEDVKVGTGADTHGCGVGIYKAIISVIVLGCIHDGRDSDFSDICL